ncbi:MAG: NADP-dependent oxidoreductase [Bdellovibrionales bacterium]|nr:NADP-dependent oxidoreductase [Bdellovibrionales bacterium]
MRAVIFDSFGGSEKLRIADVPTPEPQRGEVQIRVAYTSVNPVDWKIREGHLVELLPHHFPIIPGWDVAGTVSAIGPGVKAFHVGDQVYAYARKPEVQWGTYAEYVCLDEAAVARKPKTLSFAQAAGIPLTALTAWQALFDFAALQEGETVLIHAGAGGVGSMAIQFAKQAGAKVITTASAKNHAYVSELGADEVIDYTQTSVPALIKKQYPLGLDIVFDCAGGKALDESYDLLRSEGRLVSIVETPNPKKAEAAQLKAGFVFVSPNSAQLKKIADLVDSGVVLPQHTTERPLEEAAAAQDENEQRHVRGKVVLKVN